MKAEKLASGVGDFKAIMDWLEGFKSENNITFESVCGKSGGVDQQEVYNDRLNFRLGLTAPKNYHCS